MDFLRKLQNLPEGQKRIIVWGVTIFLGVLLLAWWVPRIAERLRIQQGPNVEEQFQLRELQQQMQNIPYEQ